ncbi:MAG TPA: acyltransferase [Candidatus Binatia bacterium]|nr:acyltransferase [Candidatus Binatia bacterium]
MTRTAPRRLDGVDGLRALAALWVVLFHIRAFSGARLGPLDLLVRSGSTGVSLFLVLSGFCLYLPVARGGAGNFRTLRFLRRRAVRLLPAYYASLAVVLLVTVLTGGSIGLARVSGIAVLVQTVTHVTMTHSLFPSTFYALNGAYWSLALEWQLYLGLPLLVIAARRLGLARTVALVVAVNVVYRVGLQLAIALHAVAGTSLMATAVLPNLLPGRWAEFGLGMVAAQLHASGRIAGWAPHAGWAILGLVPLTAVAVLSQGSPLEHLLFGAVFFVLLCIVLSGRSWVSRAVSWRPLAAVGVMSYSLYLVHQPIVQAVCFALQHTGSPRMVFVEVLLLVPGILVVAWLLFVTVERWTLRSTGGAEPGSPEALLLAPLNRLRRRPRPAEPVIEVA